MPELMVRSVWPCVTRSLEKFTKKQFFELKVSRKKLFQHQKMKRWESPETRFRNFSCRSEPSLRRKRPFEVPKRPRPRVYWLRHVVNDVSEKMAPYKVGSACQPDKHFMCSNQENSFARIKRFLVFESKDFLCSNHFLCSNQ